MIAPLLVLPLHRETADSMQKAPRVYVLENSLVYLPPTSTDRSFVRQQLAMHAIVPRIYKGALHVLLQIRHLFLSSQRMVEKRVE